MIDSGIDFLVVLAQWYSNWDHVGTMFGKNGATLFNSLLFFVGLVAVGGFFSSHFLGWLELVSQREQISEAFSL